MNRGECVIQCMNPEETRKKMNPRYRNISDNRKPSVSNKVPSHSLVQVFPAQYHLCFRTGDESRERERKERKGLNHSSPTHESRRKRKSRMPDTITIQITESLLSTMKYPVIHQV